MDAPDNDLFKDGFGLLLSEPSRRKLWAVVVEQIESYLSDVHSLPVASSAPMAEIQSTLASFDFKAPMDPQAAVEFAGSTLKRFLLHTTHPAYFGVFNPAAGTMGVAADALVAALNPQLASSASARICIEMENHLMRYFGEKFGYERERVRGTFTSGGTIANLTGVLCALCAKVPEYATQGVSGVRPVIYVSQETHHSILRAARICGLGTAAVTELPVKRDLKLDLKCLVDKIHQDRQAGRLPVAVVSTLGTTSAGTFDDMESLARIAAGEGLWLHTDAAWGGAAALLDEFKPMFCGVERSDSITLDAHKWLSVPMGAGMFFTRHPHILEATFRVGQSPYMPGHTYESHETEPYKESMEWSRRFVGLKLFLALAVHGEEGYKAVLRHQVAMGDYLRQQLRRSRWEIVNETPLPVVCFVDPQRPNLNVEDFAARVAATGRTWITPTTLRFTGQSVCRAGISNFTTQKAHIDTLVDTLDAVRASLPA